MVKKTRQSLNDLRAEVSRAERLTQQKLSRIQKQGVKVITPIDPRLRANHTRIDASRYTERQLRSYLNRLNEFRDRKTQFVSDAHGRPIDKRLFDEYKSLESEFIHNERARAERVANLPSAFGDMTVGEYAATMTPAQGFDESNPAVNNRLIVRTSKAFTSEKALNRMIDAYRGRVKAEYRAKQNEIAYESFKKMASLLNDPALIDMVGQLSAAQWDIAWNHQPQFARGLSLGYEIAKAQLKGKSEPDDFEQLRVARDDIRRVTEWAKQITFDKTGRPIMGKAPFAKSKPKSKRRKR